MQSQILYKINESIESLIDQETGEIYNPELLKMLQAKKEETVEQLALFYKNLNAEAEAVESEQKKLKARVERLRHTAESIKKSVAEALSGENFSTSKVEIKFRKTLAKVVVEDGFIPWALENADDLLRHIPPEPNKELIKQRIKSGEAIEYINLVQGKSMSII